MSDNPNRKSPLRHWAGVILVVVLLIWLVWATDFKSLWHQLHQISPWVLALLIVLQLATQLLITCQWHLLTGSVLGRSSFIKILHIFTRGSLVEAVTPGAKIGGEAVRLYLMKKELLCSTNQAVSIIAIQKSISMSVLLTVCLASLLHIGSHIAHHLPFGIQLLSGGVSLALVIFMVGLLFFARPLSQLLMRGAKWAQKLGGYLTSYADATGRLSRRHWWLQFSISTAVWLLFPIKMVILAAALGVRLPFSVLLSVTMVSYMMGMFPLTPGGIGTFEGTMLALLTLLGVGHTVGLTITLVFRFVTFWFVILASALFILIYESCLKLKGSHHIEQNEFDSQSP